MGTPPDRFKMLGGTDPLHHYALVGFPAYPLQLRGDMAETASLPCSFAQTTGALRDPFRRATDHRRRAATSPAMSAGKSDAKRSAVPVTG